ncbi:DegT/DnrJ/EryC1/StrS family aminotransferase [Streptomyces sp. LP05-1]|uniref:DegT/DnrJ/EryC1/StrS family aminotransferase n=1 Tax=Streptomyces pyxinae TaxID=2970734 RepID=A0ABT2CHQ6_9ACTN|nr:aminotransferase class I/II-fold pyridoxal phosphate-dependent enzyme [Streptomyces sp. LP05-1]MCS0636936.1 DegT/DnrJ/EryC1/StrS family aminotransferase [Streptomyces sp. LP05-1]
MTTTARTTTATTAGPTTDGSTATGATTAGPATTGPAARPATAGGMINPHQLFDLSREDADSLTHLRAVLGDGQLFRYVEGDRESANTLIERHFAGYFRKEAAAAVANGTVGLRLALRALGIGPGDRVLVNAYAFIACAMAITAVGATPVPMDLEPGTLGADPAALEAPDGPVAAVMIVHVQGHALPTGRIRALCDRLGVPLIEDVCQGLGAESSDGRAGQLGDVAVTSFQQAKQIASGEGGLVAGSAEVIERVYRMADLGAVRHDGGLPDWDDERAIIGDNQRMSELQAALVMDQAEVLDDTLARQRDRRARLREALGDVPVLESENPGGDAGSHTLLLARGASEAQEFCAALAARGVLARLVWKKTWLEYGLFQRELTSRSSAARPWSGKATALAPRILSVPTSKYLTDSAVAEVADAVVANRHHLVPEG